MSTDLTTSLLVWDDDPAHKTENGFASGLRFVRTAYGKLLIRGFLSEAKDAQGAGMVLISDNDAVMLRDWLNNEWPVDDKGGDDKSDPLWGGPSYLDDAPLKGCGCELCEEARRNG